MHAKPGVGLLAFSLGLWLFWCRIPAVQLLGCSVPRTFAALRGASLLWVGALLDRRSPCTKQLSCKGAPGLLTWQDGQTTQNRYENHHSAGAQCPADLQG